MRCLRFCVIALMPLLIAACATGADRGETCDLSQGTNLFFGRNVGTLERVSDADWTRFLDETVRPRFPGHTVYDATGYWQGTSERSKVLSIYHDGDAATSEKLTEIAKDYRLRFDQESVLRADFDTCVVFVGD